MPFTIAAKAAFLIALTWEPNGFVKHQYQDKFVNAIECFKAVDQKLATVTNPHNLLDWGCTYLEPISAKMVFYRPKAECLEWEENGLFIKDTSYD